MSNSDTNAQKDEESKVEKRARWEAFEFRVPCEGSVRVENVSYGAESDDHTHVVTVEHGCATDCTCTYCQYNDVCKHMLAVEEKTAVIVAATPEIEIEVDEPVPLPDSDENEGAATADEPMTVNGHQVATDGGQELTKLEEGVTVTDKEGVEWTIDTPVEQVATESGYQPRIRLVSEYGTVDTIHPREFAKKVNKTEEYVLLNDTDDNERTTPR